MRPDGAALILITHDLGVIAGHAERICVMYAGKLVETGSTEDVFYHPGCRTRSACSAAAAHGPGAPRAAHPDQGLAALAAEPAAGMPVHPAVPDRRDICDHEEPTCCEDVPGTAQAAACHFRDRTKDADAADLFGDEANTDTTPTEEAQ